MAVCSTSLLQRPTQLPAVDIFGHYSAGGASIAQSCVFRLHCLPSVPPRCEPHASPHACQRAGAARAPSSPPLAHPPRPWPILPAPGPSLARRLYFYCICFSYNFTSLVLLLPHQPSRIPRLSAPAPASLARSHALSEQSCTALPSAAPGSTPGCTFVLSPASQGPLRAPRFLPAATYHIPKALLVLAVWTLHRAVFHFLHSH